ncbi:nucleotidyltransferase-like protein [Marinicrinis lubricantis]|uniref:Nucleotidyltransferase-like protein n=1 Tax=Marinicrinis lubricantis TaxID=2086470 RepID=A0ABW1IJD3_9BACL
MSFIAAKSAVSIDKFKRDARVNSVIAVQNTSRFAPVTDGFDLLLLVITNDKQPTNHTSHYIKENVRVQERWIHISGLYTWILNGQNRHIIEWMLDGTVLLDRSSFLQAFKKDLQNFPVELRKEKLLIEFSRFLRSFLLAKEYWGQSQSLDAYSHVLMAINHWARIVIIESGKHPEITVWNQIHSLNPGVYKLYEELTTSQEPLDKRVELVLLACDFSVMTKMKDCCSLLLQVIASREEPWTSAELKQHPDLEEVHVELSLILNKLVKRSILKEVLQEQPSGEKEICYTCLNC